MRSVTTAAVKHRKGQREQREPRTASRDMPGKHNNVTH